MRRLAGLVSQTPIKLPNGMQQEGPRTTKDTVLPRRGGIREFRRQTPPGGTLLHPSRSIISGIT